MLCRYVYCISVFFVLLSVVHGVSGVLKKLNWFDSCSSSLIYFISLFYFNDMQPQYPQTFKANCSLCKHISASCNVPAVVMLYIVNSY